MISMMGSKKVEWNPWGEGYRCERQPRRGGCFMKDISVIQTKQDAKEKRH